MTLRQLVVTAVPWSFVSLPAAMLQPMAHVAMSQSVTHVTTPARVFCLGGEGNEHFMKEGEGPQLIFQGGRVPHPFPKLS